MVSPYILRTHLTHAIGTYKCVFIAITVICLLNRLLSYIRTVIGVSAEFWSVRLIKANSYD